MSEDKLNEKFDSLGDGVPDQKIVEEVKANFSTDDESRNVINYIATGLFLTWRNITYIGTSLIVLTTLLQGFKICGFELSDFAFITTIISIVISSTILGYLTKLLGIRNSS